MITLTLQDVSEVNKILVALGKLPYEQVCNLIGTIQTQTTQQLQPPPPPADNTG